jgi:tetratricopeptide (TPR) repeat protein
MLASGVANVERIEKTVFISYRRVNVPWALAVSQNLTHYGYDVFFDFNGITSGDFEQIIIENIKARAHFLLLLTPSALERCNKPQDWLRREIETALDARRNMVPLMLEGFDFATPGIASQLTGSLAALRNYNALRIPSEYFDEAMERLRQRWLNLALRVVSHPASPSAMLGAQEQQAAALEARLVSGQELTAQAWFERGVYASDPKEKVQLYSEAIRLNPDFADAFFSRGTARKATGDLPGAHEDYNEAIRLNPGFAKAFYAG